MEPQQKSRMSIMRLMGILSLLTGIGLAIAGLIMRVNLTELSLLVGVFVGAAFSGKAVQKFAERKRDPAVEEILRGHD